MKSQNIIFKTLIHIALLCTSGLAFSQSIERLAPLSNNIGPSTPRPGFVQVIPIDDAGLSPDMKSAVLERRNQQETKGFVEVPEHEAKVVDTYFSKSQFTQNTKPLKDIERSTHLNPAALKGTILEAAEYFGASTAGGHVNGKWTGLVRAFESDELGKVVLEEYDYIEAGSHFFIPQEVVDSYIGEYPVLFAAVQSRSGSNAYTDLTWFTERKQFRLRIGKLIQKTDDRYRYLEQLMATLR